MLFITQLSLCLLLYLDDVVVDVSLADSKPETPCLLAGWLSLAACLRMQHWKLRILLSCLLAGWLSLAGCLRMQHWKLRILLSCLLAGWLSLAGCLRMQRWKLRILLRLLCLPFNLFSLVLNIGCRVLLLFLVLLSLY